MGQDHENNESPLKKAFEWFFYSFPVQLLVHHFKRNHILVFAWFMFFMIILGQFGNYLGIPLLFLDPEYLYEVSFFSFFIMGVVFAGFTIAFHITTYIMDGPRFSFLGAMPMPFSHFSLNNSIIPAAFVILYIIKVIDFQVDNQFAETIDIIIYMAGLFSGFGAMLVIMLVYFRLTNKDIFRYVAESFDERLKRSVRLTRARVLERMQLAKKKDIRVDNYISLGFRIKKVPSDERYLREAIRKVFDQNHLNLIMMELLIFILLLFMGIFREVAVFQLPAAASFILFFTIIVMFLGAFSYWFREWSVSVAIGLFIVINFLVSQDIGSTEYKAFGLDYTKQHAPYSTATITEQNAGGRQIEDKNETIQILNNWKTKLSSLTVNDTASVRLPKAVFLCTSGGGQRASLWTMKVLQSIDSVTNGKLFDHTVLITGASGGIIGASYFRELKLQNRTDKRVDPYARRYLDDISRDNLNPIIFSFLVNDVFVKFQNFEYGGKSYSKDRGYSFEAQINRNTGGRLDKPLVSYKDPERLSQIPMMILGPTIINDGRKLFISPQNVSYMNIRVSEANGRYSTPEGIDFQRFFQDQDSDSLRFLSALRMNATFPFITPNITLPSDPAMEIMDAGISDNFGISDAIRFIYVFRNWLKDNTSGILLVSIRDSQRETPVTSLTSKSLVNKISKPISSIYVNFENLQEISNSDKITFAESWYDGNIKRIDFQYIPQSVSGRKEDIQRASLSWRLTQKERADILSSMKVEANFAALNELVVELN